MLLRPFIAYLASIVTLCWAALRTQTDDGAPGRNNSLGGAHTTDVSGPSHRGSKRYWGAEAVYTKPYPDRFIVGNYAVFISDNDLIGEGGWGQVYRGRVYKPKNQHQFYEVGLYAIKICAATDRETGEFDQARWDTCAMEAINMKKMRQRDRLRRLTPKLKGHGQMLSSPGDPAPNGAFFVMIMEYLPGKDLHELAFDDGAFWSDGSKAKKVILEMLDATATMHATVNSQGMRAYHLDLTLANIFRSGGKLYLIDFAMGGFGYWFHGPPRGPMSYYSPELWDRLESGELGYGAYTFQQQDEWSLAVAILAIVMGFLPVDNDEHEYYDGRTRPFYACDDFLDADDATRELLFSRHVRGELGLASAPMAAGVRSFFLAVFVRDPSRRLGVAGMRRAIADIKAKHLAPGFRERYDASGHRRRRRPALAPLPEGWVPDDYEETYDFVRTLDVAPEFKEMPQLPQGDEAAAFAVPARADSWEA